MMITITKNSGVSRHTNSISTVGLLGVVFVTLKLFGVINWSWWLVTLPFWGGLAILLFIFMIFVLIAASK
jgi:hypothetical protein